jgi:hypothetical protein
MAIIALLAASGAAGKKNFENLTKSCDASGEYLNRGILAFVSALLYLDSLPMLSIRQQ